MKTFLLLPAAALAAALALTACSSGDRSGVATLEGGSAGASPSPTSDLDTQVQAYVECLRKQGLDLPDPSVDADGNVSFGAAGALVRNIDRDQLRAAQLKCGEPPTGLSAIADRADDPAFQDAALKFAQCMRGQGVNVPDPDFSKVGNGGLFGGLKRDDPKTQAAIKACQHVWTGVRLGGN